MSDTADASVTMTSGVRGLIPFARPAAGAFALAGVLSAMAALLSLVPFWAIYRCVDSVVTGDPTRSDLWRLAVIALVAIIGRFALFGLSLYISHMAAYRVLYEIRMGVAERLTKVPLGYVTNTRAGHIKKVMGDDVERLELFLAHGIADATAAVVTLVGASAWLIWVDWRMGIAAVLLVFPAFACMARAMRNASSHMVDFQNSTAEMNSSIVELIRGMPVVKVFNRSTDEVRTAETSIRAYVSTVRTYSLDFLPLGTAFFVLIASNVVTLVPLGIWLHSRGSLSTTDLLFFFIVGLGVLAPVLSLLNLFSNLAHLSSGGNLVSELLAATTLDDSATDGRPADSSVELRNVSFGYSDQRVLHDVSFTAAAGSLCALVGPSGSGKSTIAALVGRFWDVDEGAVLVGGADVRRLSPEALSRQVSMVLQDTFLFDDTIAGNLRVAKADATDAELEAVCRAARAHEFIAALPDGYSTMVGENGTRLSGGERQRLTIARAMLADAPLIVLDEATAFTDPENESAIQEAIGRLVEGRTVLMIAHRLSTVVRCDQIVVIDHGRIVQRARHDELVAADGLYRTLWNDFIDAETIALGDAVRSEVVR